ncbi:MAG: hypothetical protein ACFFCP_02285 [Promethearchaeota archaeon]
MPSTERFNRGGQGLSEIAARVRQHNASAVLIISMWKGNPSTLSFSSSSGDELASINVEMAMLRREVNPAKHRINGISGVFVEKGSSIKTQAVGQMLASLLDLDLSEASSPDVTSQDPGKCMIWLQDTSSGKVIWTHYHTTDGSEIGPRIKVASIRQGVTDET